VDVSEIMERRNNLSEHPFDLNKVTEEQLISLVFLSPLQIANINSAPGNIWRFYQYSGIARNRGIRFTNYSTPEVICARRRQVVLERFIVEEYT
jgi:hypothetical protein